jgi:hypothetical protein
MKILKVAMLFAGLSFVYCIVNAQEFYVPQVSSNTQTSTNAQIVLSTPTVATSINCIQHLTVESPNSTTVDILSLGTTIYSIVTSTGVPFDTQWGAGTALCGNKGQQMTIDDTGGGAYTISIESFVTASGY